MRSVALALALGLALVSGCATIMAGGPDRIPVTTNPPGATVYVDNVPVGQTPTLVTLDRSRGSGMIRIEMPGFAPVVIARDKYINGWFWVNIVLLSPLGIIIDLVTGDIHRFDDTPIVLGLTPGAGGPPPAGYAPPPGYPPAPAPYPPPPPRR